MQTDDLAAPTKLVFSLPPVSGPVGELQTVSKPARPPTSQPLQASCSPLEFARAMVALTTLKRTSDFTEKQLQAWHCVLRRFPAATINLSVVELATSETRFPELADLFRKCHAKMPKAYCPMGDSTDAGKPSPQLVKQIAQDMGLTVD